jgi:hypothetical protein
MTNLDGQGQADEQADRDMSVDVVEIIARLQQESLKLLLRPATLVLPTALRKKLLVGDRPDNALLPHLLQLLRSLLQIPPCSIRLHTRSEGHKRLAVGLKLSLSRVRRRLLRS